MGALAMPLAMGAVGFGTAMQVSSKIQEGKNAQKLANYRAALDIQAAENARIKSVEESRILAEKRGKIVSSQKAGYAAGGVMLNVGAPLVVAAQTREDITKDIEFILESGRMESAQYRASAAYEKASGKMARKQSVWDAIGTGVSGFGSMAYMGYQGGMFGSGKYGFGSGGQYTSKGMTGNNIGSTYTRAWGR
jgi:hypothetical protein